MRKNNPDYLGHNELITNRSGNPYQYFHYTAWGESFAQAEASQGSFSSSYRFNAKELDQETGNYYYGARYYDPKWSVWLSVDPLAGEALSWTPYRFSFDNPINVIDPKGLFEDIVFTVIGDDGTKTEIGRIPSKIDVEFEIPHNLIPIDLPDNILPALPNAELNDILLNTGVQAVSLDLSGEAAAQGGGQMELSIIGIVAGENEGQWGLAGQLNGLAGAEASVTGSYSVYWPAKGTDLDLNALRGFETGCQGSIFNVSGSYFEGLSGSTSFPYMTTSYRGISFGGPLVGIKELPRSFSIYLGYSDFFYRSDSR